MSVRFLSPEEVAELDGYWASLAFHVVLMEVMDDLQLAMDDDITRMCLAAGLFRAHPGIVMDTVKAGSFKQRKAFLACRLTSETKLSGLGTTTGVGSNKTVEFMARTLFYGNSQKQKEREATLAYVRSH